MIDLLSDLVVLAATKPEVTTKASDTSGWLMFFIVVAIFVVPMALGSFLGKTLKLKDLGFKIGALLLTVVLGLAPFVYQVAIGNHWMDAVKLGIDLAGGTNLVFQVDVEAAKKAGKDVSASMEQMVGAIRRRINPGGLEEVTVRKVGADRIEVITPGADAHVVAEMKRRMTRLGSLEFEILANERDHGRTGIRNRGLIDNANTLPLTERTFVEGTRVIAMWRDISEKEEIDTHGEIALRTSKDNDGKDVEQVLVMVTPERHRVTGKFLVRAYQTVDQDGSLAVGFTFNQQGAFKFQTMTSRNRPLTDGFQRRLAILLDNKVQSAPNLRETISSSGIVSGNFTQTEISELIDVLNAGALEIPIKHEPISEFTISPLLGADIQQKGKLAIGLASVMILIFMISYYRFAGLIANLCLVLNLILVMGTMALVQGTFTLPGLAGLVLTIGMAVDANVLIFERIREELNRGSNLRMAIQNGFSRAFTTIVDANVTTLIVAVVLYMIGTDQVRGFAVTLFIGIVMSMFSALYGGRLMFDILERKRWLRNLKMMSIVRSPRFDFIGKKIPAAIFSLVLIVAGMASLASRGSENLDIDFRGGAMVTFEFVQPQNLEAVRTDLEAQFGSNITLERLTLSDEDQASDVGRRYRLRTTDTRLSRVRKSVAEALKQRPLRRITMTIGEFSKVAKASELSNKSDELEEENTNRTPENKVETVAAPTQSAFGGGHQVDLIFSDEITESTAADGLVAAVATLKLEYPDPNSLFRFTGTKGSGLKAGTNDVKKFSEMQLQARSAVNTADLKRALNRMQTELAETPLFEEVNQFETQVGMEMQQYAIMAMLISLIAIVAYIWFRFQRINFGLAAVAALVHDVLVVVGMVALASLVSGTAFGNALLLSDFRINLPMIAAFLTIVGYSLNDTIVVFDRIREVRGKNPALTSDMVNSSLNQTLARTLLTSITTFLVVSILYGFGGEGIHGFAFCLVLGVLVGTYSSIYVASPVLLWLMNRPGTDTARTRSSAKAAITS